jgi:3D (Asp-Asp-Asp) domain-containing protein
LLSYKDFRLWRILNFGGFDNFERMQAPALFRNGFGLRMTQTVVVFGMGLCFPLLSANNCMASMTREAKASVIKQTEKEQQLLATVTAKQGEALGKAIRLEEEMLISTLKPSADLEMTNNIPGKVEISAAAAPQAESTATVLQGETLEAPIVETDKKTVKSMTVAEQAVKTVRVRLTFYSGEMDQWGDRVAWQKVARASRGRTVAADPKIFPYGTCIEIPGFGRRRVEDTGSAVKAKVASRGSAPIIDVYVGCEKEVWRLAAKTPEYVDIQLVEAKS